MTETESPQPVESRRFIIWIDAQLPPALALWLRDEGETEAYHVQDLDLLSASDREILDRASRKGDVVIVTKDADFPALLQRSGPPPYILWLRLGNVSNRDLRQLVLDAWPRARALFQAGEPLVEIRRDPGIEA